MNPSGGSHFSMCISVLVEDQPWHKEVMMLRPAGDMFPIQRLSRMRYLYFTLGATRSLLKPREPGKKQYYGMLAGIEQIHWAGERTLK